VQNYIIDIAMCTIYRLEAFEAILALD